MNSCQIPQRRFLAGAGFDGGQIELAVTRFGRMTNDEIRYLGGTKDPYDSALFVYTVTGAKPATAVNPDEIARTAQHLGMPILPWAKHREQVTDYARTLGVPDADNFSNVCKQALERNIIGYDKTSFENLMKALLKGDRHAIGKALGYPETADRLVEFPEIDQRVKEQKAAGVKFAEPLLYIEHQCIHSMGPEAVRAGQRRKASLLAFGCEAVERGLSQTGTELAIGISNYKEMWKHFNTMKIERPKPQLPDVRELISQEPLLCPPGK